MATPRKNRHHQSQQQNPKETPPPNHNGKDQNHIRQPTPPIGRVCRSLHAKTKQYLNYAADARPILTRFAKRLSKTIAFQHLELNLELGTEDPAFTGRLFGYVEAFKRVFGKRIHISITPDFLQPRFAASGSLRLSIYLHRLDIRRTRSGRTRWTLACKNLVDRTQNQA